MTPTCLTGVENRARPVRMMPANAAVVQWFCVGAAMPGFQTVCRVSDLGDAEGKVVEVDGKLVAVFREAGRYFAIDDVCPHMGASLSGGYVEDGIVTCPWHAWRFRLEDGAWADYPKVKIGCYPVRVVGDDIQVQVGAACPDQKPTEERT